MAHYIFAGHSTEGCDLFFSRVVRSANSPHPATANWPAEGSPSLEDASAGADPGAVAVEVRPRRSPYRVAVERTRAELIGHRFDLDLLAGLFHTGEPRVVRDEDGRYWVESSRFDGHGEDLVAVHQLAKDVLVLLNAAGRLEGSGFRPVDLQGQYQRPGPDGPVQGAVLEVKAAEMRTRSTVVATLSVSGTFLPLRVASGPRVGVWSMGKIWATAQIPTAT